MRMQVYRIAQVLQLSSESDASTFASFPLLTQEFVSAREFVWTSCDLLPPYLSLGFLRVLDTCNRLKPWHCCLIKLLPLLQDEGSAGGKLSRPS